MAIDKNFGFTRHDERTSLEALSGAYNYPFWEAVCEHAIEPSSVESVRVALLTLYEIGKYDEAMNLVRAIFDLTEMDLPEAYSKTLDEKHTEAYLNELLSEAEDIIEELIQ